MSIQQIHPISPLRWRSAARVTALDGFLFGGGANAANIADALVELVRGDFRETSHMGGQNDPLADIAVNAVAQVRLIQEGIRRSLEWFGPRLADYL
jgi:hypothetical protein